MYWIGLMSSKPATQSIYQIKILLNKTKPPIWRRIIVPGRIPLCCLHDVLQVVMGWTDSHLHKFEKGGKVWADSQYDELGDLNIINERRTPLNEALKMEGDSMVYVYNFGEDWRHTIVLEKVMLADGATSLPVCLSGKRHCPPEDVGGASGYKAFLRILSRRSGQKYVEFVRWAGASFKAEDFAVNVVNEILAHMRWPIRQRR
jgi:hypothetical protein